MHTGVSDKGRVTGASNESAQLPTKWYNRPGWVVGAPVAAIVLSVFLWIADPTGARQATNQVSWINVESKDIHKAQECATNGGSPTMPCVNLRGRVHLAGEKSRLVAVTIPRANDGYYIQEWAEVKADGTWYSYGIQFTPDQAHQVCMYQVLESVQQGIEDIRGSNKTGSVQKIPEDMQKLQCVGVPATPAE